MDSDLVARINQTVDQCLEECMRSSTPVSLTLEGFCRRLAGDPEWTEPQIELIRSIVLRVI
jgi:hypothetical protein